MVAGVSIYTSEAFGSDETGTGSEAQPYKTAIHVCYRLVRFGSGLTCLKQAVLTHGDAVNLFVDEETPVAGVRPLGVAPLLG